MHCFILMCRGQINAIRCCHSVVGKAMNVLDRATNICRRFKPSSGYSQQASRVLAHAGSLKRGLVVGAFVWRVMVCTRLPDSILSKKILDASWRAQKDILACGIISAALPCFTMFVLSLAWHLRMHYSHVSFQSFCLSKLPFSVALRPGCCTLLSLPSFCEEPTVVLTSILEKSCMAESR